MHCIKLIQKKFITLIALTSTVAQAADYVILKNPYSHAINIQYGELQNGFMEQTRTEKTIQPNSTFQLLLDSNKPQAVIYYDCKNCPSARKAAIIYHDKIRKAAQSTNKEITLNF